MTAETEGRPTVVMFRPSPIDADTRAKKIALSLHRAGYDVTVLSLVAPGSASEEQWLDGVRVVPVVLRSTQKDQQAMRMGARRRRTYRPLVWMPEDEYKARVAERRLVVRLRAGRARTARANLRSKSRRKKLDGLLTWPFLRLRLLLAQAHLSQLMERMQLQAQFNVDVRRDWKRFDTWRAGTARWATERGVYPELEDIAASIGPVLDRLAPDVLHAHHPTVLPTALRAARRLRSRGREVRVVYDARENYAGIPEGEQGSVRRFAVLLRQEVESIADVDAVITVSEPIAEELAARYALPARPAVVLNVPVLRESRGPSVRGALDLPEKAPLLVYSGSMSRARGIEVLIDALALLPGVHLALVSVPYPHPMTPALRERAEAAGAADRLHVLPPVGQDELIAYLAGADVAVHPLPGGSPNHDQALPNKLFEYLHAGLPLVVSDARLMADFVREHDLGEVFASGDAADLASAVTRALARDRADRRDIAARFSWQCQEQTLRTLYSGLVPATPRPDGPFPALDVG